jgi:hypothetical protein
MAIKRRTPIMSSGIAGVAGDPCPIAMDYPDVWDWITEQSYDDGKARKPGTLSIFSGLDGTIRACITDKDTNEIAFITAGNLTDLLKGLQTGLANGNLDWRIPRPTNRKK